ncbi:putative phosphatase-like protein [Rosellinia necatrix]|uniref:Very-long-chain (3R)-3-hydroxyacyl-CoA dehydratase n=1 Tax=Rosellinia necatrix TaxID=77044 RepID=A0A1W2TGK5_ROSNE|nr:putative phosphatase-like protein [Rosellinia necatrix]
MSLKTGYLLLYNLVSLTAWTYLTARVILYCCCCAGPTTEVGIVGVGVVGGEVEGGGRGGAETDALRADLLPYVTALQTAAAAEAAHAALGLVRASPAATALQVGGRNLVLWTVARRFPDLVFSSFPSSSSPSSFYPPSTSYFPSSWVSSSWSWGRAGFLGCLLAWGCSDVLRYSFFVAAAVSPRRAAPRWLKWLRYTAFIPLYPVGFLSEASLVYLSLVGARDIGPLYRGYLFVGLLSYVPASYILYTHMFSQRRRALGRLGPT